MNQDNGGEALAWIAGILLLLGGVWVYIQIKALAAALQVDMDAAGSIVLRMGVLLILLGMALYKGVFLTSLLYLPCAAIAIMSPALTYWSWDYVTADFAANATQAWYGLKLIHGIAFLGFAFFGYAAQKWIDENR